MKRPEFKQKEQCKKCFYWNDACGYITAPAVSPKGCADFMNKDKFLKCFTCKKIVGEYPHHGMNDDGTPKYFCDSCKEKMEK